MNFKHKRILITRFIQKNITKQNKIKKCESKKTFNYNVTNIYIYINNKLIYYMFYNVMMIIYDV